MIDRGCGHVVNIASMLGKTELPGLATYAGSKHAVVGLGAAGRPELAGTGVTVTTVLPSIVKTELASGIAPGLVRVIRVEPEDVAIAIVGTVDDRWRSRFHAGSGSIRPYDR
jgi:short-subunit dehydrogenase